jgi:Ca2+-binding EF-hand superfamily protein
LDALKKKGFICEPREEQELTVWLASKLNTAHVDLNTLTAQMNAQTGAKSVRDALDKLDTMSPEIRTYLNQISNYFLDNHINKEDFFVEMDKNKDGTVDKAEFIAMFENLKDLKLSRTNVLDIFEALDINNDGDLTFNEFTLYLEGAKRTKINDAALEESLKGEIKQLFDAIDLDGNGTIDQKELLQSMKSIGDKEASIEKVIEIINQSGSRDGKMNFQQFSNIMMPRMLDEILQTDDLLEDLRANFREADMDNSGSLTVGEI